MLDPKVPRLVSVVLPCYHAGRYIGEALASIGRQSYPHWEVLAVEDGGPEDGTQAAVEAFARSFSGHRVEFIRHDRNRGQGAARNTGIMASQGDFIAFLDPDDVCREDRLAKQVEFLEQRPQVAMVGSHATVIDPQGREKGVWTTPARDISIKWALIYENPIIQSSVMIRKSALEVVGLYSTNSKIEDYELWARVADRFAVANLEDTLVCWREHAGSFSDVNRQVQRRQLQEASAERVRDWVGGEVQPHDLAVLRGLFFSPANSPLNLNATELRRALSLLDRILAGFYRRFDFAQSEVAFHRKKCLRVWGRHLLALALRRNGRRDLACRAALVGFAAKMACRSVRAGRL